MDNFLKKYNLPKLAKEIENLNSLIFNKETKVINENLTKKTQAQMVSPGNASKDFRKATAPYHGSASTEQKEGAPLRDQHGATSAQEQNQSRAARVALLRPKPRCRNPEESQQVNSRNP